MDIFESISKASGIIFLRIEVASGNIVANSLWRERWGYTEDEPVNYAEFSQRQSSQFRELFRDSLSIVTKTGRPVSRTLNSSKNANVWFRFIFQPVFDAMQNIIAVDISNVDVSDEIAKQQALEQLLVKTAEQDKTLRSEIDRFEAFCLEYDFIYWRFDVIHQRVSYNQTFASRWGLEAPGQLELSEFKSLLPPDTFDEHMKNIRRTVSLKESVTVLFEGKVGRQHGKWYELRYWPVLGENDSVVAVNMANIEVTEFIEVQNTLRATLEKQKEMFSIVGHELRTPVAAIKMLVSDTSESPENKLVQIEEIAENLLAVLEDLRVVVAPERALEKKQSPDDPIKVVKRTLSQLEPLLERSGMSVSITVPSSNNGYSVSHSQSLRQGLINLVKNAAIHSGGSRIAVSLELIESAEQNGECVIRVEDDGKGVPESLQEHIFGAFSRGETTSDGSGLGLFIVSQLARMMGGSLKYSQSQYGGACFTVTCPLKKSRVEAQTSAPAQSQRITLSNMRILLAEDERMLRLLTTNVLTKEGAVVSAFENGQLALDAYSPEKFDLVITDLMMPQMNGHELTRAIRLKSLKTPIIAVTAAVIGTETEQFIAEGADYVIPKPISKSALLDALSEIKLRRAAAG